ELARTKIPNGFAPLELAQLYQSLRDLKQAEAQWLAALKADPENLLLIHALANFYIASHAPPQLADPYIDKLIDKGGDNARALVIWAKCQKALRLTFGPDGTDLSLESYKKALALLASEIGSTAGEKADLARANAKVHATRSFSKRQAIDELSSLESPTV